MKTDYKKAFEKLNEINKKLVKEYYRLKEENEKLKNGTLKPQEVDLMSKLNDMFKEDNNE